MSFTIGDEFVVVPPEPAAVVSVAPLDAAVVSDESPLLHAVANNEIATIVTSPSLTDVIRLRISTYLPMCMCFSNRTEGMDTGGLPPDHVIYLS